MNKRTWDARWYGAVQVYLRNMGNAVNDYKLIAHATVVLTEDSLCEFLYNEFGRDMPEPPPKTGKGSSTLLSDLTDMIGDKPSEKKGETK